MTIHYFCFSSERLCHEIRFAEESALALDSARLYIVLYSNTLSVMRFLSFILAADRGCIEVIERLISVVCD